jgi:lipopolysaccharide export system permease protein
MIIFRYLSRQILQLMSAVTLILLIVALTSRFIQYLAQAVAGDFSLNVLFFLVIYRLPDFLMVILPLALFMGVLLVFGRMYSGNEMVVLLGSGYSEFRLLLLTLGCTGFAMIFVAVLSLAATPWGLRNIERIKQDQSQLTEIDLIVPRQFRSFGQGNRVAYTERASARNDEVRRLENVFVAVSSDLADTGNSFPRILFADSVRSEIDENTGARLTYPPFLEP